MFRFREDVRWQSSKFDALFSKIIAFVYEFTTSALFCRDLPLKSVTCRQNFQSGPA